MSALIRRAGAALVLAGVLWAAGCGPARMDAPGYQRYVLDTLAGITRQDDSLSQILGITIGDLSCDESFCAARFRFQYLRDELQARRPIMADLSGRICHRDEVRPPQALEPDHETLCAGLDGVFRSLDRIVLTASNALLVLDSENSQQLLEEIVRRLAAEQAALRDVQRTLRGIEWLRPAL